MPYRCDFEYYVPPRNVLKNTCENKIVEILKNELLKLGKKYNDLKSGDEVTQLLCYACGTLIDRDNMSGLDERLIKWWKDHNDWDKHRTLETLKKQFGSNPDQCPTKDGVYKWFVTQAESVHPLSEYHKHEFFNELWDKFTAWIVSRKSRAERIAELEAELAKLKAEA